MYYSMSCIRFGFFCLVGWLGFFFFFFFFLIIYVFVGECLSA
jgi:hypothetical protein